MTKLQKIAKLDAEYVVFFDLKMLLVDLFIHQDVKEPEYYGFASQVPWNKGIYDECIFAQSVYDLDKGLEFIKEMYLEELTENESFDPDILQEVLPVLGKTDATPMTSHLYTVLHYWNDILNSGDDIEDAIEILMDQRPEASSLYLKAMNMVESGTVKNYSNMMGLIDRVIQFAKYPKDGAMLLYVRLALITTFQRGHEKNETLDKMLGLDLEVDATESNARFIRSMIGVAESSYDVGFIE